MNKSIIQDIYQILGKFGKDREDIKKEFRTLCEYYKTIDHKPDNCSKEYKEDVCEECEFKNFNMVGHPGGSSYHSTEEYYCELGYWKDDF